MEERRSWEESTSNVLKVVVIILFFIGAAIFGKRYGPLNLKMPGNLGWL